MNDRSARRLHIFRQAARRATYRRDDALPTLPRPVLNCSTSSAMRQTVVELQVGLRQMEHSQQRQADPE